MEYPLNKCQKYNWGLNLNGIAGTVAKACMSCVANFTLGTSALHHHQAICPNTVIQFPSTKAQKSEQMISSDVYLLDLKVFD